MLALIASAVTVGMGLVTSTISAPATHSSGLLAQLIVANNACWALCIHCTKASMLSQYLRLFGSGHHTTRALCYVLLAALLPSSLYALIGGIALCDPVAKLWSPELDGQCHSAAAYWTAVAAVDIALDISILVLPLPAIGSLRLPRKQKVSLVLVLALGFGVCVVSVTRLATVLWTAHKGEIVMSGVWAVVWSVVEANIGIVCASLLALRPLLVKFFPQDEASFEGCISLARVESDHWRADDDTLVGESERGSSILKRFSVGGGIKDSCMPRQQQHRRDGSRKVFGFAEVLREVGSWGDCAEHRGSIV